MVNDELENQSWIPAFAGMTNNKYLRLSAVYEISKSLGFPEGLFEKTKPINTKTNWRKVLYERIL